MPPVEVVLLRWPMDEDRRLELAEAGRARVLLVDPKEPPPALLDCGEDWVRVPASEEDLHARVQAVAARWHAHDAAQAPAIDADGVVRFADRWIPVPPVEARLAAALIDRFGAVVGRDALAAAGWPAGAPGRNALDVHMLRLRRRLGPLGLGIRTVRSRGYLLEAAPV